MRRRIYVDMDGVLCKGEHWTGRNVLNAKPNLKIIKEVNRLYIHDFIIVYTARQNHLIGYTMDWLDKHNVHYHAISNHKLPIHYLFDDRAFKPNELSKF